MAEARDVFDGITIEGPTISEMPEVDLLSGFEERVEQEALKRFQETMRAEPYREMVAG